MFLVIYAASGPLHYSLYTHTERCVIMQFFCGLTPSEATRIVIKYQLSAKTNSCVFNWKIQY